MQKAGRQIFCLNSTVNSNSAPALQKPCNSRHSPCSKVRTRTLFTGLASPSWEPGSDADDGGGSPQLKCVFHHPQSSITQAGASAVANNVPAGRKQKPGK